MFFYLYSLIKFSEIILYECSQLGYYHSIGGYILFDIKTSNKVKS